MSREAIIAKIESLPEESRNQLLAFLDFLAKHSQESAPAAKPHSFKFDWAGGLADLSREFTAVELQHQANEWR